MISLAQTARHLVAEYSDPLRLKRASLRELSNRGEQDLRDTSRLAIMTLRNSLLKISRIGESRHHERWLE